MTDAALLEAWKPYQIAARHTRGHWVMQLGGHESLAELRHLAPETDVTFLAKMLMETGWTLCQGRDYFGFYLFAKPPKNGAAR